jgi:EAL domain-containing protein (putative c-di-GMP-specific phosphodiesterase class I)
MNARSLERLKLENALRHALDQGELALHYQPLIHIRSGQIVGTEALLRWSNPELGSVPPDEFVPLAEESGLIVPIGDWVLRAACEQNAAWQRAGLPPIRVSVNLSSLQFQMGELARSVHQALTRSGLAPWLLELEITETVIMRNAEENVRILRGLKEIGLTFSVDDFGTGYSSLSYLKRFPIDTLKIDHSFVKELAFDSDDAAIVTAIIAMGHSLKLRVIAEGVETPQQLQFLREQGCDLMQGFLFCKPLPPEQLEQILREAETTRWALAE